MYSSTTEILAQKAGASMTRAQKNLLIVLIGGIASLGPFTIDMYLPGFPEMAAYFQTNEKSIAYTLTSFFVGISIGQLIYGPLLDRFGRKPPLLIGLTLYLLASIACIYAPTLEALILARFVQALGSSVGMVAGNAIIRDLFDTKDVAKMYSSILLVMGAAPIVAPTLGSYVVHHFGWKAIFFFLTIVSGLLIVNLYLFLKDSRGADRSFELKLPSIAIRYWNTLRQRDFFLYSLGGSLAMAIMFAYISSIPLILMGIYEVSETTFGWLFGLNAFGFILGSQCNRLALKKFEIVQLTNYSARIMLAVGVLFCLLATLVDLPLSFFCLFLFLVLFLLGFINPNATALSLDRVTENVGLASALNGSMRMGAGALVSGLMGLLYNGTIYPLLIMILGLTVLSFICLIAVHKSNPLRRVVP